MSVTRHYRENKRNPKKAAERPCWERSAGFNLPLGPVYFCPYTKWARRFCCQQLSVLSVQNGFSLP